MLTQKLRYFDNVVYAPNIHQGGGKTLLLNLIQSERPDTLFVVDKRLFENELTLHDCKNVISVNCGVIRKLFIDFSFRKASCNRHTILYFSNIPPVFRLRGRCNLFLQNRYLIENYSLKGLSAKAFIRILIERVWFRKFLKNVDQTIVQSVSMYNSLTDITKDFKNVQIYPLMNPEQDACKTLAAERNYDFIYVASAEPHKNHLNLINAWNLLAQKNRFPSLLLTFDPKLFPKIQAAVHRSCELYRTQITNMGNLDKTGLFNLYRNTKCLVYPSKLESFGLPLLEAHNLGLKVVASELDFVRDLLDPDQTFNPNSPLSIMRAIERMEQYSVTRQQVYVADHFLEQVFGR
jgi:glycosyltransferase involved in cell wall biosynthesis